MNKKLNFYICKNRTRTQFYTPNAFDTNTKIKLVLWNEVEKYYRQKKKIADCFQCKVYMTKNSKIAVVSYDTPRKRLYAKQHTFEDFAEKYGFIPKPVNVLKRFIDFGYVKSETVEHLYHTREIDYEITDDLQTMRDAYAVDFAERDSVCDNFNGFSCMSNTPEVGDFYYYFGASLLVFRDKYTREIVGRGVLWNHEEKKHLYKVYCKVNAQTPANEIKNELVSRGIITTDRLPQDFESVLQRVADKTPAEILEEIQDTTQVPYVDEYLQLSGDKTKISKMHGFDLKSTNKELLCEFGSLCCDHCGNYLHEDDAIYVDGYCYCNECACWCSRCEEWHHPNANGEYINGDWVCESCIEDDYTWCEECEEYHENDETQYIESAGYYVCERCLRNNYTWCEECEEYHENDRVNYVESVGGYVCDSCLYDNGNFFRCEECEEWYRCDQCREINGKSYCEHCAEKIPVDENTDEESTEESNQ